MSELSRYEKSDSLRVATGSPVGQPQQTTYRNVEAVSSDSSLEQGRTMVAVPIPRIEDTKTLRCQKSFSKASAHLDTIADRTFVRLDFLSNGEGRSESLSLQEALNLLSQLNAVIAPLLN